MEVFLNVEIKDNCNISPSHFVYLASCVNKFWRQLFTDRWNFEDEVFFRDLRSIWSSQDLCIRPLFSHQIRLFEAFWCTQDNEKTDEMKLGTKKTHKDSVLLCIEH